MLQRKETPHGSDPENNIKDFVKIEKPLSVAYATEMG